MTFASDIHARVMRAVSKQHGRILYVVLRNDVYDRVTAEFQANGDVWSGLIEGIQTRRRKIKYEFEIEVEARELTGDME